MSTKNLTQLIEDAATNEEIAKKLSEADRQVRKTGDKTVYIKAAAELGYEVTEQDFPDDDFVKLDEKQLDDVAGGLFWFGEEDEEGNELDCFSFYYRRVKNYSCPISSSGKHKFTLMYEAEGDKFFKCDYCGETAQKGGNNSKTSSSPP